MFYFLFFIFLYSFLERWEGREKRGKKHRCVIASCVPYWTGPATQECALPGNWTSNPLIHRTTLNLLSDTSQSMFHFLKILVILKNISLIKLININSYRVIYCKKSRKYYWIKKATIWIDIWETALSNLLSSSPLSSRNTRRCFSNIHCENQV